MSSKGRNRPRFHETAEDTTVEPNPRKDPAGMEFETTVPVPPTETPTDPRAIPPKAPTKPGIIPPKARAKKTPASERKQTPPRGTEPLAKKSRTNATGVAQNTQLEEIAARLEQSLSAAVTKIDILGAHLEAIADERDNLSEQKSELEDEHKSLLAKTTAERDTLNEELGVLRREHTEATRRQSQALTDMQDLRRTQKEELAKADKEIEQRSDRISELETQLAEALASRDRIAERVHTLEAKLEQTVLPLREEIDEVKAREAELRGALEGARTEIQTLKMLVGPPQRD